MMSFMIATCRTVEMQSKYLTAQGLFWIYFHRFIKKLMIASLRQPLSSDVCLLLKLMIWPWEAPADRVREVVWCRASWWLALVLCCCLLSIITNHWADTDMHLTHTHNKNNTKQEGRMQMTTGNWVCFGATCTDTHTHSAVSYSRLMRQQPAERLCPSLTLANGPYCRLHPAPFTLSAGSAVCLPGH